MDKSNQELNKKNIILIGFMAAGKSSVGRILARQLGWSFVDTDKEIEQVTGLRIAELFRKHGELRFRSEENLVVKKLVGRTQTVVATGGGTVLAEENWQILHELGTLIHLYVPLHVALSRVKRRQDRPLLLKKDIEIEQLWHERLKIYNQADIIIDTTDKDLATIAAEILTIWKGGQLTNAPDN
ncbi:MAG TPA: shikimate kinase [Peptococcaceae bacterium]|nr:shikimate kinase [Peptococcaceae bacterium]